VTDSAEELKAQIAQTREVLAQTTAALMAKTDVKGRVRSQVRDHQTTLAVVGGGSVLLLALLFWRRRR
jgi:LPXTG-motif cell wall-anchored protein